MENNLKSKKKKHFFLLVRIAIVAGGIIWAVSRIGQEQRWDSFMEYLRRMNIWVFFGVIGIFFIGHLLVSLRWWLLLRSQSIFIDLWTATKLYFLGWFYNNFMPSSVGGDLIRAWYVTRHTEKKFEAALSVFVDRIIGLLSTLLIAGSFYFLFFRGKGVEIASADKGGFLTTVAEKMYLLLGAIAAVAVIFIGLMVWGKSREKLKNLWAVICIHGYRMTIKLKDAIVIYCKKPMALLIVFALTVFMQIMVITGLWVLGVNMGIDVNIKSYYVLLTLSWVIGAIPISIGGAVVVEGAIVILFTKFAGTEESAAWAIALSQRALWMITSLPGAAIHLIGAHLPTKLEPGPGEDFSID